MQELDELELFQQTTKPPPTHFHLFNSRQLTTTDTPVATGRHCGSEFASRPLTGEKQQDYANNNAVAGVDCSKVGFGHDLGTRSKRFDSPPIQIQKEQTRPGLGLFRESEIKHRNDCKTRRKLFFSSFFLCT